MTDIQSGIAFICKRRGPLYATKRIFKSECGSKVTFKLSRSNAIVEATSDRLFCKKGCAACEKKIAEGTKIIHKTA